MDLNDDFWKFVAQNRAESPSRLRLKYHGKEMPQWIDYAVRQIECQQKAGNKFGDLQPRLMLNPLSVEQSTSASVARLHARLIRENIPGTVRRIADLTCGMGIDLMAMRLAFDCHALGFELNRTVAEASQWNYADDPMVEIRCADSVDWLENYDGESLDVIFVDPARRADDGGRVYAISQCAPDVKALLPFLEKHCRFAAVKLSPMLDVTSVLRDLPQTCRLFVIGNRRECLELFALLDFTEKGLAHKAGEKAPITIIPDAETYPRSAFTFSRCDESGTQLPLLFDTPSQGQWLFEPSAATMKGASFALLCHKYNMTALHPNTHLFIADTYHDEAPGRWFRVVKSYPFTASNLKNLGKEIGQADVAVRNFPMTADELSRRLKLRPGGTRRLMAVTVKEPAGDSRHLILLEKGSLKA